MRHASNLRGGAGTQSRMDNVNYEYVGRSYGVGSSIGLTSSFVNNAVQTYRYSEDGFLATSDCIYNSSSASFFNEITPDPAWTLRVWNGVFLFPNMVDYSFIATAGQRDYQILVISAYSGEGEGSKHYTHMMSPAGSEGFQYGKLHQIQCELKYEPMTFQIMTNTTNNTIKVTPQQRLDVSSVTDFSEITKAFTHRIYNIGQMFSSNQWGSPMGDAFMNNIDNLALSKNESIASSETVLEAVSASVNSMLDSIIQALSSAQLMIVKDVMEKPVTISSRSVVFGDRVSIYVILAINAIVTIIFLIECFRTGIWKHTPVFDYMKVLNLVLSSSAGGASIAKNACNLASSEHPGDVRIMLIEGSDGTDVLVPAYERLNEERFTPISPGPTSGLISRGGYEKI